MVELQLLDVLELTKNKWRMERYLAFHLLIYNNNLTFRNRHFDRYLFSNNKSIRIIILFILSQRYWRIVSIENEGKRIYYLIRVYLNIMYENPIFVDELFEQQQIHLYLCYYYHVINSNLFYYQYVLIVNKF